MHCLRSSSRSRLCWHVPLTCSNDLRISLQGLQATLKAITLSTSEVGGRDTCGRPGTCHFGRWAACGHDGHDGDLAVDLVSAGVHRRADRLEWGQGALGAAASRRALNWRCNAPQFFSEPYPTPRVCAKESIRG